MGLSINSAAKNLTVILVHVRCFRYQDGGGVWTSVGKSVEIAELARKVTVRSDV